MEETKVSREDIIRMAREAGAVFPADGSYHRFESEESLERFASLVASAEREACAMMCEEFDLLHVAEAIRYRSKQ